MTKYEAILALNPNIAFIRGDVAYDAQDNVVEYDQSAADAYVQAHAYIEQRQRAYPSIPDQLDMIWHAINNNSLNKDSDFYKLLKGVKDANPKAT